MGLKLCLFLLPVCFDLPLDLPFLLIQCFIIFVSELLSSTFVFLLEVLDFLVDSSLLPFELLLDPFLYFRSLIKVFFISAVSQSTDIIFRFALLGSLFVA
jgi:hypothetical protein